MLRYTIAMPTDRLETLRAMVIKNPGHALARYGLANELVKAEKFDEALTVLRDYLAMHDDEGSAFRLLAACYIKLDRTDEAREAYRRGIEAANRHGHPGMAAEFEASLEGLDQ
jgi:Flp pilus assembly protein TadD